jgi:hypothetical protein
MYGVGVLLELLGTQFEKEVFKEIKFDDEKIQKHWNLVVEIYEKQKNNKNI